MMKHAAAMLFGILLLAACKTKLSQEQRYVAYVNDPDNKITQTIKVGETDVRVKWLPEDYQRLTTRQTTSAGDESPFCYFNARFDKTTGDKPDKAKMMYLDFDMEKDFSMLLGKDSLLPAICQKIETGVSGRYEYLLAFKKPEKTNKDFTLVYNDKIFGIGTIAFVYKEDDIKRIPALNEKSRNEISDKAE